MNSEIKHEGQGTIFEDSFLEPLTKCPPYISATIYSSIGIGILYVGIHKHVMNNFWTGAALFVGAIFLWTLFEYFAHRYIFHLDEYFPDSKFAHKLAFTLHGIHHEYPRDKDRIVMPPVPGMLIIGLLFGIYYAIMGNYVFIFLPGFMTGYLLYTRVHYKTHTRHIPSYLKSQYRRHSLHHYKYPDKAFGISTGLWDRVFGTMPPE
ncbi:MAG TPA: sterol desaturase family protein [Balneolaceae bacterium]|nr:sterol desaturase family protein [Balneolaceae bacterium]